MNLVDQQANRNTAYALSLLRVGAGYWAHVRGDIATMSATMLDIVGGIGHTNVGRIAGTSRRIKSVSLATGRATDKWLAGRLTDLASSSAGFEKRSLDRLAGVKLPSGKWQAVDSRTVVAGSLFLGKPRADHWGQLFEGGADAVTAQVRVGMISNFTGADLRKFVRDQLESIYAKPTDRHIRTMVGQIHNAARDAQRRRFSGMVKAIRWVAALERRTCPTCAGYDGKLFDLDHNPIGHKLPWNGGPGSIHPRCRCTDVTEFRKLIKIRDGRLKPKKKAERAALLTARSFPKTTGSRTGYVGRNQRGKTGYSGKAWLGFGGLGKSPTLPALLTNMAGPSAWPRSNDYLIREKSK